MDNLSPITAARFWSKVDVKFSSQECWEWRGAQKLHGYGSFRLPSTPDNKRQCVPAHRVAYSLINGGIPDGLIIRHTCDNPKCVNPHHLLTGTHKDNAADKVERGRAYTGKQSCENNGAAKLTWADVVKIRERSSRGESNVSIARDFDVSHSMVSKIKLGHFWADKASA